MGKPFEKELELIYRTLEWTLYQDISKLRTSLLEDDMSFYVVGSGGSLSACSYASLLLQQFGTVSQAITPLEIQYVGHSFKKSCVLFLSASGKNNDILFGLRSSIKFDPIKILSISTSLGAPLTEQCSAIPFGHAFEYDLPTRKDGFLATNSLIAFFSLLYRCFYSSKPFSMKSVKGDSEFRANLDKFISSVESTYTFVVIYAGWGKPIAIDIESKMAEAALGDVLITDYRNFGHGRHHWFDKRGANSAIIALISPAERDLANKTLSLIPAQIPTLRISTEIADGAASIDLLIKSFHFIERLGKMQGIDPGKPGVPDFGTKMYHLNYQRYYKSQDSAIIVQKNSSISRKANVARVENLDIDDYRYWSSSYDLFVNKLESTLFGCLVLDYDGTLCSSTNRFIGVDPILIAYLDKLLYHGIIIGIATGRGKSVKAALREAINKNYWERVIIGYYNGSEIGSLQDDSVPNKSQPTSLYLEQLYNFLQSYQFAYPVKPELRPMQLSIEVTDEIHWKKVRPAIIQAILSLNLPNIRILESSHSLDIVDQSITSKLHVVSKCQELNDRKAPGLECLCIGDKGKWPGNDYQLLSTPYSLSVEETSSLTDRCWNLAMPGVRNIDATKYYLSCLKFTKNGFKFRL